MDTSKILKIIEVGLKASLNEIKHIINEDKKRKLNKVNNPRKPRKKLSEEEKKDRIRANIDKAALNKRMDATEGCYSPSDFGEFFQNNPGQVYALYNFMKRRYPKSPVTAMRVFFFGPEWSEEKNTIAIGICKWCLHHPDVMALIPTKDPAKSQQRWDWDEDLLKSFKVGRRKKK